MGKKWLFFVVCICLLLTGCNLWMDGSYHSVTPHHLRNEVQSDVQILCDTYEEIRVSLEELVENGSTKGVIYVENFSQEELESHMDAAINYVTKLNPIGTYAVESIQYDIGTNAATPAVAVEISYIHNRFEILRIKRTANMEEAYDVVTAALDGCNANVVFYVEQYTATDIAQWVEDYVAQNPASCMEMPQVSVVSYPENGEKRVIEVSFTYQTSRETLRSMQDSVVSVFKSAELYVSGDAEDREKYAQLYSFLMARYDYSIETSITPAYSLLRHGVGDSKAFATVYAQMCRLAGLDCQIVSGTKEGKAWYWNAIWEGEEIYYVDLLACREAGSFGMKLGSEMDGYVWDYAVYPYSEPEVITAETVPEEQDAEMNQSTEETQPDTSEDASTQTQPPETIPPASESTEPVEETVPLESEPMSEKQSAPAETGSDPQPAPSEMMPDPQQ